MGPLCHTSLTYIGFMTSSYRPLSLMKTMLKGCAEIQIMIRLMTLHFKNRHQLLSTKLFSKQAGGSFSHVFLIYKIV